MRRFAASENCVRHQDHSQAATPMSRFVRRIRVANQLEVIFMRKSFLVFLFLLLALPVAADEGMWLFNRTPNAIFKQRYGFEPTQAWLDHLQKSSIRFNSGGSGSFVS